MVSKTSRSVIEASEPTLVSWNVKHIGRAVIRMYRNGNLPENHLIHFRVAIARVQFVGVPYVAAIYTTQQERDLPTESRGNVYVIYTYIYTNTSLLLNSNNNHSKAMYYNRSSLINQRYIAFLLRADHMQNESINSHFTYKAQKRIYAYESTDKGRILKLCGKYTEFVLCNKQCECSIW